MKYLFRLWQLSVVSARWCQDASNFHESHMNVRIVVRALTDLRNVQAALKLFSYFSLLVFSKRAHWGTSHATTWGNQIVFVHFLIDHLGLDSQSNFRLFLCRWFTVVAKWSYTQVEVLGIWRYCGAERRSWCAVTSTSCTEAAISLFLKELILLILLHLRNYVGHHVHLLEVLAQFQICLLLYGPHKLSNWRLLSSLFIYLFVLLDELFHYFLRAWILGVLIVWVPVNEVLLCY